MNRWFAEVKTVEELRKRYRELLKNTIPTMKTAVLKLHRKSMQNMTACLPV